MTEAHDGNAKSKRDPSKKATDAAALRAIAQAALEVELFTIPLYMASLYSIHGTHAINSKGNDYYKGRLWPGAHTVSEPKTNEEKAFNILFSIFIEEMLHMQLAANMASAVSDKEAPPKFSNCALVDPETHAWNCYGAEKTCIPHIIALQHTHSYKKKPFPVDLGALTEQQLPLFLTIERPEEDAREDVIKEYREQYFPEAPFDDIWKGDGKRGSWLPGTPLPMFGSIGWMYQCYKDYVNLSYSDGSQLWCEVFNNEGQQNDLFNNFGGPGHPMREYMGFETTIALTYKDIAKEQMLKMMDAITDQGEGSVLKERREKLVRAAFTEAANRQKPESGMEALPDDDLVLPTAISAMGVAKSAPHAMASPELTAPQINQLRQQVTLDLQKVKKEYRASEPALRSDYPSYTDNGELTASADAEARASNGARDHYERFEDIGELLKGKSVLHPFRKGTKTWPEWWEERKDKGGWKESDLHTASYHRPIDDKIPSCKEVADALNALRASKTSDYYKTLSQASVGAIAGVLTVLDNFWDYRAQARSPVSFPFPSMVGSGDRMAICWAVFGKAPDLALGLEAIDKKSLNHACQGIDLAGMVGNDCAQVAVFHACRGSNQCNAQGGCGFVQPLSGGGNCKTSTALQTRTFGSACSPTTYYNAPGDNKCGGFGGCAVPISAAQLFPRDGQMQLFEFVEVGGMSPHWEAKPLDVSIPFCQGDKVDAIAYAAYKVVMEKKGATVPEKMPAPNLLRIALPPST